LRPVEPQSSSGKLPGLPKPLPLGEVALRSNDGEGKPGRKEPLRSDGQALCQSDAIAVPELFGSGLALSVSLRSPALPEGEPLPEGLREFVENARQKREEFVKVIKMRRRY